MAEIKYLDLWEDGWVEKMEGRQYVAGRVIEHQWQEDTYREIVGSRGLFVFLVPVHRQ
jgi:hypothetical protein